MPPAPTAAPRRATVETPRMSRATGSIVLPAPTGQTLRHALDAGLSGLARLNEEPLAEPAHVPEDDGVVPIQDLLYRGKAALARAREVIAADVDANAHFREPLDHHQRIVWTSAQRLRAREQQHGLRVLRGSGLHGAPREIVEQLVIMTRRGFERLRPALVPLAALRSA